MVMLLPTSVAAVAAAAVDYSRCCWTQKTVSCVYATSSYRGHPKAGTCPHLEIL